MSTDKQGRRTCDGCYAPMINAHKLYKVSEYCGTCYSSQFVSCSCPTCSGTVVYHASEPQAPSCDACLRNQRRCIRCDRPAPEARIIRDTTPGPDGGSPITYEHFVCPSCFPYTTPEIQCPICKRSSQRLAGAAHLPDNLKACPSCLNKHTHATCVRCRRYRKVVSVTEEGRPLCIGCGGDQPAEHTCPDCGSTVKGAGAARCDSCSIAARLRREVALCAATIEREWVASLYTAFGEWLLARNVATGGLPKKAVQAAPFFRAIDLDAGTHQPIVAADLLRLFDSKQLRANLNVTRFICKRYGFQIDENARARARDIALIELGLEESASKPWARYLTDYRTWLAGKPTRTQAQYLRTAQAFCEAGDLGGPFAQEHLVRYLDSAPGSRANLSVWVGFVRARYGWAVTMPPKVAKRASLRRDAQTLMDLLPRVRVPGTASDEDLAATIALAYGFELSTLRRQVTGVTDVGDLITRDGIVEVKMELRGVVAEWSRRAF